MYRNAYCGALTEDRVGQRFQVCGWAMHKRDMGGVIFLDVRDVKGVLQVVCNAANLPPEQFALAEAVRLESVVMVEGALKIRDEETYNPRLATGAIELMASSLSVLSQSEALPFSLEDGAQVREDLRMEYRFLDLRRPAMQEALRFRHRLLRIAREYLDTHEFTEVETPMLTKSTPEGARDYLVPSRVHPGEWYALPQSPQIFKQLLMVGGLDKYYQVARCFRDEDLRADRQPEFTQLDMELSFVTQEEILVLLEKLFKHIMRELMGVEISAPFPRMTWHEAMDRYASDKPDIRFGLPIVDVTDIAGESSFSIFRSACGSGGLVRAINVKGAGRDFSKTDIENLTKRAQSYGAKGMAWILLRTDGTVNSILTKYFSESQWAALMARMEAEPGDFILFCADKRDVVLRVLGSLRLDLGDMLGLRPKDTYAFLFVTDFPQFEWSEEEGRFMSTHHPFTMPYEEDVQYLLEDPARVRAQAYDVVLNGIELGSGSIRIHDSAVQKRMFQALGFSDAQIQERFGFLVRAFSFGTPPHGGFAFGVDRLAMQLLGADSLRQVIAFPKTKDASCLLTGAPSSVDPAQLEELSLGAAAAPADASSKGRAVPELDVANVARLAMLRLSGEEQRAMHRELSAIISFADQLSAVETDGVPITAHVVPLKNVLRPDAARMEFGREALLQNAPSQQDGYVRVPPAIE